MRQHLRPFSLPAQFEARFIAGRVLWFLPVLSGLLVFFWRIHTRWFPLFAAKYALLLVFIAWHAWRKAGDERRRIERIAEEDVAFARSHAVGSPFAEVLPLACAAALCGIVTAAAKHDVRWLVACAVLAGLLGLGLTLRWLIYERWVRSLLRVLELRWRLEA